MSLTNPAYLASIVQLQVKKMYEFYDPEENKNISRCEKIQAIDFEYFEAIQIKKLKRVQIPSPTKSAKLAISFLMKEAYAKEDNRAKELFEQNQVIATRIAYDYGQDAWFSKMLEKWKEDFIYLEAIKDTRRLVRRERDRLYSLNTQIF